MWKAEGFFEVDRLSGWSVPAQQDPPFEQKEQDKKTYGLELAKINAKTIEERIEVAKGIFGTNQGAIVMWVAGNWHLDPVVIAARDSYVPPPKPLLDKEALAAKLLECAEERIERNGQKHYINEAKDRLGFYNLYSKIMGFIDKPEASTTNNFASNEMKIVLVRPDQKAETKAIESVKKVEDEVVNVTPLRIKAV